jgi:hypothetical protein
MRRWRGKCDDWARNRGLQPAFSGFSVTQKARSLPYRIPAFRPNIQQTYVEHRMLMRMRLCPLSSRWCSLTLSHSLASKTRHGVPQLQPRRPAPLCRGGR